MGAELAPFGLAAVLFVLGSTQVGHHDLVSLIAQQPAVSDRSGEHMIGSPLGTTQTAAFPLPRPIGTMLPEPLSYTLARFETEGSDLTAAIPATPQQSMRGVASDDPATFQRVNRTLKGDRLVPDIPLEPAVEAVPPKSIAEPPPTDNVEPAQLDLMAGFLRPPPPIETGETDELDAALRYKPFPEYDISLSLELDPKVPAGASESPGSDSAATDENVPDHQETQALFGGTRLYFDGAPLGASLAPIESWAAGEAPIIVVPTLPAVAANVPSRAPAPAAAPEA